MKKTFKKPLALALAVLMLLTSIPFSALALPGDYEPNIKLLFGSAGNTFDGLFVGEGAYEDSVDLKNNLGYAGIYGAPIDFNYVKTGSKAEANETVTGTLSLNPSKTAAFAEYAAVDNITSKTTLGVGDYFIVTVVAENVKVSHVLQAIIGYSNNIEPAGIYSYKSGKKTYFQYAGISEGNANSEVIAPGAPLESMGAKDFYATINSKTDTSSSLNGKINVQTVSSSTYDNVSTTTAASGCSFFDQTTGAAISTLPTDTMVLNSFLFKIVGNGDISFNLAPDTAANYTNGTYIASQADGVLRKDITSYTPGDDITEGGSGKMTFMAGEAPAPVACYDITVKSGFTNGTVTMAGDTVDPATGATKNVEVNTEVTLVATPDEGAKFLGWKANDGTTVSTEATFKALVNANVTYTPVFAKASEGQIILTFEDAFENIVDVKVVNKGTTPDPLPVVPARAGYKAVGWSVTDFTTLKEDTVITPIYTKITDKEYTVEVPAGSTIKVGNGDPQSVPSVSVPYNTQVTVYNASAKSWKINGATVAYGDTYTFYVGANVVLTIDETPVTVQTPVVGSVNIDVSADGKRVSFLATRKIDTAEGWVQVNAGFMYGTTGVTASTELVDVNGTSVKAVYTKTGSEQFSISFNVTPGKTYNGRAFITYKNAADEINVAYANLQTYKAV